MKADPICENEAEIHASAQAEHPPRGSWSPPSLTRLRAGLAETGTNSGYDGVEGTS